MDVTGTFGDGAMPCMSGCSKRAKNANSARAPLCFWPAPLSAAWPMSGAWLLLRLKAERLRAALNFSSSHGRLPMRPCRPTASALCTSLLITCTPQPVLAAGLPCNASFCKRQRMFSSYTTPVRLCWAQVD